MSLKSQKITIIAVILGIAFAVSGCFFAQQNLVIKTDGTADISVELWFDKYQANAQGAIGIQELLYLFPDLQNYTVNKTEKSFSQSTYLVYTFQMDNIDLKRNRYIDFMQQDDGSYYLTIKIPKVLEEEESSNDDVLKIKVIMPAEIDMANSMKYSGNTVQWELRTNDFTTDTTLKVFTKPKV